MKFETKKIGLLSLFIAIISIFALCTNVYAMEEESTKRLVYYVNSEAINPETGELISPTFFRSIVTAPIKKTQIPIINEKNEIEGWEQAEVIFLEDIYRPIEQKIDAQVRLKNPGKFYEIKTINFTYTNPTAGEVLDLYLKKNRDGKRIAPLKKNFKAMDGITREYTLKHATVIIAETARTEPATMPTTTPSERSRR
jgi:hypothetical protein